MDNPFEITSSKKKEHRDLWDTPLNSKSSFDLDNTDNERVFRQPSRFHTKNNTQRTNVTRETRPSYLNRQNSYTAVEINASKAISIIMKCCIGVCFLILIINFFLEHYYDTIGGILYFIVGIAFLIYIIKAVKFDLKRYCLYTFIAVIIEAIVYAFSNFLNRYFTNAMMNLTYGMCIGLAWTLFILKIIYYIVNKANERS